MHYRERFLHCVSKNVSLGILSISVPINVNRFSEFFHWHTHWTICNKVICEYTTLTASLHYLVKYKECKKKSTIGLIGVLVNERHFRRRSRRMIRCCTVLDPSLWISGVLNDVFESSLPDLVGLSVHSQWLLSFQYVHALICRSCAYGRCFLFPEWFSDKCPVFPFCSLSLKIPSLSSVNRIFELV